MQELKFEPEKASKPSEPRINRFCPVPTAGDPLCRQRRLCRRLLSAGDAAPPPSNRSPTQIHVRRQRRRYRVWQPVAATAAAGGYYALHGCETPCPWFFKDAASCYARSSREEEGRNGRRPFLWPSSSVCLSLCVCRSLCLGSTVCL